MKKRRDYVMTAFTLPSILGLTILYLLPAFTVFQYAFTNLSGRFCGFSNIQQLFQNESFKLASRNTLFYYLFGLFFSVLFALLFALYSRSHQSGVRILRIVSLIPLLTPSSTVVMTIRILFHENGLINNVLEKAGFLSVLWYHSEAAKIMLVILLVWKTVGYNAILLQLALNAIPDSMIQAARLDGAGPIRIFINIQLPCIANTIMFTILITIIQAAGMFRWIYLLFGDYPGNYLYLIQHFLAHTFKLMDYQKMCGAAVLYSVVVLVFCESIRYCFKKRVNYDNV